METLGIDIGGTHVRAARVSATGEILARARAPSSHDPHQMLAVCQRLAHDLRGNATALGIGIPGQVDAPARRVLSGGYVDLSSLPFADLMEEATGLPTAIENDATMALLAEAAHGAARGLSHAVMLTIGTGIGGAILADGRVLRGQATAGQLGHLVIDPMGRPCVCGRRGCVETTSAGTAFAIHVAEAGLPPETKAEDLLARPDDPRAIQVLDRWARPLRAAIDSLITILNPQAVVIGGGAGAAMLQALARIPPAQSWFDAPVLGAALGDDAGVIGAATAARPRGKRLVMVNGVPASGKTAVARALSDATGWPLLSLDTVKTPFLHELAPVDRLMNRRLGRASYAAIFDIIAAAPSGATFIVDAWFGFQPEETFDTHLARAGIARLQELWCAVPPEVAGARYAARVADRPAGHPGLDYVPELIALAERARPMARGPVLTLDTTAPLDLQSILRWLQTEPQ